MRPTSPRFFLLSSDSDEVAAGTFRFSLEDVAWASTSDQLMPADVLSTGTLPGCCGLELDRWLKPDDLVELEVPKLGTWANRIGDANIPARIEDLMPTAADAVEAAPAAG